ncbi:alpha/beta fold hydrolase [Pseudoxanthomonas sp.]|uniref:alpha/beta hydrolase n=1 Tax=Pseudoxanthomonas sp. TaxID=1871049 RepID=UPI0025E18AB8|nr:alpha/beta fold hydrolase [Pseudoxanthomonas sp.]
MRRILCLVLAALVLAGCAKRVKETPLPPPVESPQPPPPPPPPPPSSAAEAAARAEAQRRAAEAEARARQQRDATAREAAEREARAREAAQSGRPPQQDFVNVDVFYATNRTPAAAFASLPAGDRFTPSLARQLTYGTARISIPKVHVAGELESPRWYLLEFKEDPKQHVILQDVTRLDKSPFFARLYDRVGASRGRNAFVFVHGYNVSFRDAARRTAQLAYDLRFDGAPVFYSWPSQAALSGYFTDEQSIARSVPYIENFLSDLADRSGAQNLYVIGHSMGTRGLTQAVRNLVTRRPELRGRFRGIILAAPDIDAKVFRTELAPALQRASGRVTLYASSEDLALKASKQVNRGPRAGDTSEGVVLVSGVDTIDVSGVDQSVLAHSYFMESDKVMGDIREMFRANQPAAQRKPLQSVKLGAGMFWKILPPP